jgi:hypothetical protein
MAALLKLAKIFLPTKNSKCPVNYYLYLKVDKKSNISSGTGVEWKESNMKVVSSSPTGVIILNTFLTHVHALYM